MYKCKLYQCLLKPKVLSHWMKALKLAHTATL